jgi:hypothetical protein
VPISADDLRRKLAQQRAVKQTPQKPPPQPQAPRQPAKDQDTLPDLPQIEQAVLQVIFANADAGFSAFEHSARKSFFVNPVNRELYNSAHHFYQQNGRLDWIAFTAYLTNTGRFEELGGHRYITELFVPFAGATPPFEVLPYYIGLLSDNYVRRQVIVRSYALAGKAKSTKNEDANQLLLDMARNIEDLRSAAGGPNGTVSFSHDALKGFVAADDPNILLGNRWLCRGFTSLLAGPAGAGKSSLEMQMAIYWACGVSFCGIRPIRPLKSLILQAENDLGDSAEPYQSVLSQAKSDFDLDESKVAENVHVEWIVDKSGFPFCSVLDQMIELHKPDIAWIDPLFAFAGCDLMKPKETTDFIRHGLYPIAIKRNVALLVVHHIGKSYRDNTEKEKWTDLDFQYLGFGTSEIQNAFRAVTILLPVASDTGSHEKIYRLILSKRGNRSGAKDMEGHRTTNLYLAQSNNGIFWTQVEKPQNKSAANAKHKAEEILDEMSLTMGKSAADLQEHMKNECGLPRTTFYRLWKELKTQGLITLDSDENWIKKPATN